MGRKTKENMWVQKRNGINRLEVIDKHGRQYVVYDSEIYESVQDNGKTLKIFVKPEINEGFAELRGADLKGADFRQ